MAVLELRYQSPDPFATPSPAPPPPLGHRRLHSIPFHPFSTAENHPRNSPFLPPPRCTKDGEGGISGRVLARKLCPHFRHRAARLSYSLSLSLCVRCICMTAIYIYNVCMCVQVWKLRLFSWNFSLPIFTFFPSFSTATFFIILLHKGAQPLLRFPRFNRPYLRNCTVSLRFVKYP